MEFLYCPYYDKCLKVDFPGGSDTALLSNDIEMEPCSFQGYFLNNPDSKIYISAKDCMDLDPTYQVR